MAANYEDPRLKALETEKQQALTKNEALYGGMIQESDANYQAQIDALEKNKETQSQLQQQQTDFEIQKIEQQKDQAEKDYKKEQSAAYKDYQKESNRYGVHAEKIAANGMMGTGYSESSRVQMYSAYQQRVAVARQSIDQAMIAFDNAMTQARLQNSTAQAQIAIETLQQKIALQMEAFAYRSDMTLQKVANEEAITENYNDRLKEVLAQIQSESYRTYDYLDEEEEEDATPVKDESVINYPMNNKAYGGGSSAGTGYPIDMDSVAALGFGNISAAELNELEANGVIESYVSGGKLKFRKKQSAKNQNQMVFR